METFIIVLAVLAGVIGILGSVLPGLAGPPISWLGLLILYLWGSGTNAAGEPVSLTLLLVLLGVVIVVGLVNYLVPGYFTKMTGGSKYAGWGAVIGLFVGLIYPPVGMIAGSLIGAFIAEFFFAKKGAADSVKAALGAFLGFLFSTGINLILSGVIFYYIIVYLK